MLSLLSFGVRKCHLTFLVVVSEFVLLLGAASLVNLSFSVLFFFGPICYTKFSQSKGFSSEENFFSLWDLKPSSMKSKDYGYRGDKAHHTHCLLVTRRLEVSSHLDYKGQSAFMQIFDPVAVSSRDDVGLWVRMSPIGLGI